MLYDNLLMSYFGLKSFGENTPPTDNLFGIEDVSGVANTVTVKKNGASAPTVPVEYSYDGVTWISAGSTSTTAIEIPLPANSKFYLRGNTTKWCNTVNGVVFENRINATGEWKISGNIKSLVSEFRTTEEDQFNSLFAFSGTLVSAEDLIIDIVAPYSHHHLFYGCSNLVKGPQITVQTLEDNCFYEMFAYCYSLNEITCLATDLRTIYSTYGWVYDVPAGGTFTKAYSMSNWSTGMHGIPYGWTVVNNE